MVAISCDGSFSSADLLLNKMQNPLPLHVVKFCKHVVISTILLTLVYFLVRKYQKKINNSTFSECDPQHILFNLKRVRDKLYSIHEKLEDKQSGSIIKSNIYNALVLTDDLIENIEIYLDPEIDDLVQKINLCL